ncbi:MAG: hypothetical protein JJU41_03440 [Bacteroidetes bacterium]|nr:hypothetical protein [Bacteroidota bacterium]MCH8525146.1 hypothetical protein [Balneolales bacterium]
MKTTLKLKMLIPALLLFWTGCNTLSPDGSDLTDEEIEIASQIIAESLADQSGGMLSSLYDALSTIEEDRISYGRDGNASFQPRDGAPSIQNMGNANGRGVERGYVAYYNPETGQHIVSFTRSVVNPAVSMSQTVRNVYIYTDEDGNFLEFPARQRELIAAISFIGQRTGTQQGPVRQATSTRTDTLFVSGLQGSSDTVSLEGVHYHEGSATMTLRRAEREAQRTFSNSFRMEDVRIDKATVRENGNLENGVTGLISYRLIMRSVKANGDTESRDIQGFIELEGDGTALLRFGGVSNLFRIVLSTGEVN